MSIQDTYNMIVTYHGRALADRITHNLIDVIVRQELGACLEKFGSHIGERYRVMIGRKQYQVSRLILEAKLKRPLTIGMLSCHSCDNPSCLEPNHLFEGTTSDNMTDKVTKGRCCKEMIRSRSGSGNSNSKLTVDRVQEIRTSSESYQWLATKFGVNKSCIQKIRNGLTWKHLLEPQLVIAPGLQVLKEQSVKFHGLRITEVLIQHLNTNGPIVRADLGPCWTCLGSNNGGYGLIGVSRRVRHVTNLVLEAKLGRCLLPGMFALHKCDNRSCANPDHLFEGTQLDNMRDMSRKGRHSSVTHPERVPRGDRSGSRLHPESRPRGETHYATKLTDQEVQEILVSPLPGTHLAKIYHVHHSNISLIRRGKSRKLFTVSAT
jgi:hypothetical protein